MRNEQNNEINKNKFVSQVTGNHCKMLQELYDDINNLFEYSKNKEDTDINMNKELFCLREKILHFRHINCSQ